MSDKNSCGHPASNHDAEDVETFDEYPDDMSVDSFGTLDHAPATAHGTYLDGINEGLERLGEYQPGGYHPIHLGDHLGASDRYCVLHKLGHGGFGTVWLCRDTQDARYVAVKVMVGDVTPSQLHDLKLAGLDRSVPGAEHIATPLDHFSVEGPNGTHQCIVLPVLGPCVSPDLWIGMEKDPGLVLRKLAYQAAQAMDFLHKNGMCHGDFRPSNILVKLANLDHLSEGEILSLLGQPTTAQVRTESGEDLPTSSPKYLVHPTDMSYLDHKYLTEQICVIDFGESFPISSPPRDLGIPENYLPPELLLQLLEEEKNHGEKGKEENEKEEEKEKENVIGPACDLWALGCTLFEIWKQIPLFYMIYDLDELLAEMARFFGKLPEEWWNKWEARADYFDNEARWIKPSRTDAEWLFAVALNKPSEVFLDDTDDGETTKKVFETPEAEQRVLADLLYKLFRYEPGERAIVDEVLEHEWFKI